MVNKQKLENLFSDLDTYLKELSELRQLAEDEYLKESRNYYSGRYLLQISIETCINISNHIVSNKNFGLPNDYADTFRILNKNNIIPENLLNKLILMTRFRNRLVHLYWDIDDKMVFEIIKNDYIDFIEYKNIILNYLKHTD